VWCDGEPGRFGSLSSPMGVAERDRVLGREGLPRVRLPWPGLTNSIKGSHCCYAGGPAAFGDRGLL
jgi:hypothetical protein